MKHHANLSLAEIMWDGLMWIPRSILRLTTDTDSGNGHDSVCQSLSPMPIGARQPSPALPSPSPLGPAPLSVRPPSAPPVLMPDYYNPTDQGNAQRLVRLHGADLRYCGARKRWLVWDGSRWTVDKTGAIERCAKDTVKNMYRDASQIGDPDERGSLVGWGLKSESRSRLYDMIHLAKSEPGMAVSPDQLDQNPVFLNVVNGTIHLHTGTLLPHRRQDLITKLAPVKYDPLARAPTWDTFLGRIMSDNMALVRFLQKAVGYTLTGDTSEQVMFILYGEGANGKTTFLNTLSAVFGDYARQTPIHTLVARRYTGIPNDVARLAGARLVTAAEAEAGQVFAESLVKQLTGQDPIPARYLYGEWFEFTPAFKIFLATNHMPEIRGGDHAIWRRMRVIPFAVTIPDEQQDRRLAEKLQEESPGILNWALEGCRAWQKEGLGIPPVVRAATDAYRHEMDHVGRFLEECCTHQPADRARAGELYQAHSKWCEENECDPVTQTEFGRELPRRGFERGRDGNGRYYLSLGLKPDWREQLDE